MKVIIILLLIVMITGCTNQKDEVNSSKLNAPLATSLDISCKAAADCKQACPIGCINKNQDYREPSDIACEQIICDCINNSCYPFGLD